MRLSDLNLRYVKLPAYQHLSDLRMSLCPPILKYPIGADEASQLGVYTNLGEAIKLVVVEGLVYWEASNWIPCCITSSSCSNLVASIMISGDGRGDEKQYTQKSQANTTRAFSLVWSLPSIHLAEDTPGICKGRGGGT